MKQLLKILSAITLIKIVPASTIGCITKINNDENIDENIDENLKLVLEIQNKAIKYFNKAVTNIEIIDSKFQNIDLIYEKASSDSNYTLNSNVPDEQKIKQYFINLFKELFENINHTLQNEYSNYYPNNFPLSFNESEVNVDLGKIFIDKLLSSLNVKMDSFSAVRVDLKLPYQISLKEYQFTNTISFSYNVTKEKNNLKIILDQSIEKVNIELSKYFQNYLNVIIDKNNDFNFLYRNFIIDYSMDSSDVDSIFKRLTKAFIDSNHNLKNLVFVAGVDLINLKESNLSLKNKGYNGYFDGTNNENLNNLDKIKYIDYVATHNWSGEGLAKNWNNDTVNKFVDFIKTKEAPIFNVNNLILSTFTFNIRAFNINGLSLTGNFIKDSNQQDLVSTFSITSNGINEKLTNWGKLIKAFYQFYDANINKNETKIKVNSDDFNNLVKLNNSSGNSKVFQYLTSKFKESENTKKLTDYNLFFFDNFTGYKHTKGNYYSKTNTLKFEHLKKSDSYMPWIALFAFGKNDKTTTGIYYAVNSYYEKPINIQKI